MNRINDILIVGAGGQARVNISILQKNKNWNISGIIDLNFHNQTEEIMGFSILGGDDWIHEWVSNNSKAINVSLAIGDNSLRRKWFDKLKELGCLFPNLVSESAIIDSSVKSKGEGNIFSDFSFIGPNCKVGDNNIFNTRSTIEHETVVGSHSHMAPHSLALGRSKIGSEVLIGASSVIFPNVFIPNNSTLGSNSMLTKSPTESGIFIGSPAKKA